MDDDTDIRRFLERYLGLEGFDVRTASDWRSTRTQFQHEEPDLVVLDLGLPDMSGFDIAARLRETSDTGIIMLTGSQDKVDKIVGLESGADDYVQKPFDERELLARIRSVLRRRASLKAQSGGSSRVASFSGYRLDMVACELRDGGGAPVHLTQGEYQLLALFVERVNSILTRDLISERLSSRDWMPTDRSIDVMVSKLRKKLEQDSNRPRLIKTIRGKGYMMTADVAY
ncbi:MAG: response regulator transcription factor [Pseudomonadales bacterium]|nr:response regulator transcription factor [Pseudomonadales bacterium]